MLLFLLLLSLSSEAAKTYGAEFEFTSDWMNEVHRKGSLRGNEGLAATKLAEKIKEKCKTLGCQVTKRNGKWSRADRFGSPEYFVSFNDGFWLNISYDPLCVEVQSQPMTKEQWQRHAAKIQDVVFESAQSLGFEPRENRAGHFNIGALSAFGLNSNVKDFLRFFVDYANHAELASGILRKNWLTAMPMALQDQSGQQGLKDLIHKVERGQIRTISEAAEFISRSVYRFHPQPEKYLVGRNQALNVQKLLNLPEKFDPTLSSDSPLEIRAVRAQKSVYEFLQLIDIFEARLSYLKNQTGPIALNLPEIQRLSEGEVVTRFKSYLAESGLEVGKYMNLLPLGSHYRTSLCSTLFQ